MYLALISYFFVLGFFQNPSYNIGVWTLGFSGGFLFGLAGGVILMWRIIEYYMKEYGLRPYLKGWRGTLLDWGPKILRVGVFLVATGVGFYMILLILQFSAIFGGNVIIPIYFGLAVLLLNLAISVMRDSPDYSGQFDQVIVQLNKIRKSLKRSQAGGSTKSSGE